MNLDFETRFNSLLNDIRYEEKSKEKYCLKRILDDNNAITNIFTFGKFDSKEFCSMEFVHVYNKYSNFRYERSLSNNTNVKRTKIYAFHYIWGTRYVEGKKRL